VQLPCARAIAAPPTNTNATIQALAISTIRRHLHPQR
jgi:hypothetical protein